MYWRLERGEKWDELKGEEAKRRMQELVTAGRAHFVIAYRGGEPVGFCAYGKRKDFPRLDRSGSFVCDDADRVWSIPCFFVKRQHRGTGVAGALLAGALRVISARGGRIAEGYPVKPAKDGKSMPAAFAWTGTRSLFQKAGFEVTGNPDGGKQRVRKEV
jgi:GNAT superfamily N-acetyltransferase